MSATVFIHVQHLLGIGHLKRAMAIATALRARGARVVVASGGEPVPAVEEPAARVGVEIERLAAARTADVNFSAVLDAAGRPIDQAWKESRRDALLRLLHHVKPDAVVTEMFPFGRRPFRFELLPLLEAARAATPRPVIAASVRDILVGKSRPGRAEEIAAQAQTIYDLVLVHGDPQLIRFEDSFPAAAVIADLLRYTGYVTEATIIAGVGDRSRGEVLVSAGGGAVGAPLLTAALAARPLSALAAAPWRLITGTNLPETDYLRLQGIAAGQRGIVLERFRTDFTDCLARCRVSISQGGYNTVLEALASRTPAVVVPFAEGVESEQTDRARLLAERGMLQMVGHADLTPARLAAAIDKAAAQPPPPIDLDLRGAGRAADILLTAIGARR
jgi:predicted glycosyltransferase